MEELSLVSVIMPTYNGERYIEQALLSVLQQSYPQINVFVCDDASKDQTPDLIKQIKAQHDTRNQIHLIQQSKNQWISRNMNTGLEAANGKYVAILDQDDMRIDPDKIAKQVLFLDKHQDHWIVWTNVIINRYGTETNRTYPILDQNIRSIILGTCPMLHSSVMYDKALAKTIGWYSESYKYAMDYKLFLDFMKKSKGANIQDITTYYRRHGNNTSILRSKEQQEEAKTIRIENRNDFPNRTKNMICAKTVSVLNNLFGENELYIKAKSEIKKRYLK